MCNPIATALTIATSGLEFAGQSQLASSQTRARNRQVEQINKSTRDGIAQLGLQQTQEREAASQRTIQAKREAQATRSTAAVAAAEAGVSGFSVQSLLSDITGQLGEFNTSVDTSLKNNQQQRELEARGIVAEGQSQANSLTMPEVPSFTNTLLHTGLGVGLDYARYRKDRGSVRGQGTK